MAIASNPATVLDCPDPVQLARFYAALLDWDADVSELEWASVESPDGHLLQFQQVNDYQAPQWPGQNVPQQFHLDFDVDDLDVAEPQVIALGATKADFQPGRTFRVFLDPAGHPFCLCVRSE